ERDQGIAYLPDGAMIVVERGEALIGTTCEVEITNVIQRSGGKLVFGKPVESGESGRTPPGRTLAESATTQPPAPRPEPGSGGGGGARRNPRRGR
ncbi:MAG: hypothetical protein VXY94_12830, partial [Planctomycetota bacterium]|nr:hypothetical protein [Planctomycetota bacterium]